MILILSILFFITGCNDKETKQQESSPQESSIYGTWKLTSFVNEADGTFIDVSESVYYDPVAIYYDPIDNTEIFIIITFSQELKITGNTSRNTFLGDYSLKEKDKRFTLLRLGMSKAGETELGNLFFKSFRSNYNPQTKNMEFTYEVVKENTLKIFYSNQEYMAFEKM